MATNFKIVAEWDGEDRVWVTTVPALGGLSTYGDTIEEALEMTREAIEGYLEAIEKRDLPAPESDVELATVRDSMATCSRNHHLKKIKNGRTSLVCVPVT